MHLAHFFQVRLHGCRRNLQPRDFETRRQPDFFRYHDESGNYPVDPDANSAEPDQPDLEQLMIRYQQADREAASSLIELLSPRFHRFFAGQMGSRSEADDMLQDVWLRIHRVRHTYRPGEPVLPWMYAIAHRVRIDNHRRRHRLSREVAVDVLPEPGSEPGAQNRMPSFNELVRDLPENQREVLTMLKVDGLSIEEVARATSSTAGAVKQRVHRAYERLRSLLEEVQAGRPRQGMAK
jgi:RNA polymerase sigma-70 factor (ECF subfamily)